MPNRLRCRALLAVVALAGLTTSADTSQTAPPLSGLAPGRAPGRVDFSFQIRPLLSDRCFRCHGPDGSKRKAKLRLDTREGAFKEIDDGWSIVKPGVPEKSELVRRIFSDLEDDRMPPAESHLTLSDAEKALLRRWVAEGADYKPHWSLIPVHELAAVTAPTGAASPIDAFVRSRLVQEGLTPAPRAAPEVLMRRVTLDLTGLPPTPAEIDAFLADRLADAYERAVDRLLASPRYGERMAMRLARSRPLRRHLRLPGRRRSRHVAVARLGHPRVQREPAYDQFLIWQLAGDLLPNATRDQRLATAFNRLHRQTNEGGSIEEEFRAEYVVGPRQHLRHRVPRADARVRALPRPQVRPDHAARLLLALRVLQQHRRVGPLLPLHRTPRRRRRCCSGRPGAESASTTWPRRRTAEAEARLCQHRARCPRTLPRLAATSASVGRPEPIAHLEFNSLSADTTPDSVAAYGRHGPGRAIDRARGVDGRAALHRRQQCRSPGVRPFVRTDPFSIALRLKPTERQDARRHPAPVAGLDRRRQPRLSSCTLDDGRPSFGLIHFWPGNALQSAPGERCRSNEWSHVAVTYDGSSRAAGVRLSRRRAARDRSRARPSVQGHQLPARGRRPLGGHASAHHRRALPGHGLQERPGRRPSGLRPAPDRGGSAAAPFAATPSRSPVPSTTISRASDSPCIAAARRRCGRCASRRTSSSTRCPRDHGDGGDAGAAAGVRAGARCLRRAGRSRLTRARPRACRRSPTGQPRNRLGLARWLTDRAATR